MLIILVLVSRTTSSVSIQDPDRNIRWCVKLLTETDVQGHLVRQSKLSEGGREGVKERAGYMLSDKEWKLVGKLQLNTHTHTHGQSSAQIVASGKGC